ncbi:jg25008 [Pararge aegeria aegeria]|uniref:Jg25008 protein n=1 Tax=Pararge aegeria aegeria TaxID=348720 RepID=A0A8S4S3M6_9NEOP|nr:jg25008 [Pararge aegeria aegeria]
MTKTDDNKTLYMPVIEALAMNYTGSLDPVAERWNSSAINFTEITMDRNFALLLVSLVSAMLWVVYITYYNSRVLGYILTRLINRFYFQDENFKIGSFTLNALSGKIMFCDIVYINYDYTLRIQDGYLIFRWWRSYVPKDVSEDLSHSDTRLSIMLNGFELHFYNRCDLYAELEKTFGLDPVIKQQHDDDDSTDRDKAMNDANEKRRRAQDTVRSEAAMARTWRDLIPVIKIDICTGRVVFGNRLVPTTFSVSLEEAHLMYSTKPPASSLDHLMHFVKAKAENCKVMLAPSPNYTSMVDEPPRYMGEGFVVMSSNYIEVYFYMDEPGLVPEQPVLLQLANGDIVESAPPIWGLDIKCGKGTDFSYGPWADRQRDHLFRFFFPPNYKSLVVTPQPKPGDRRQMQSFDIRLSTLNEATIDILFTKNKETNAVHINIGAGSYLEVTLPWIVLQDGYTTKITGQLLHLEATTSLQYRSLAESETLEYTVKCHYPLVWNHHQCWQLSLTGCKATAHFVYTHIDFFQDLTNDWASKARPDILHFVPYTWKISLLLKECEVVTLSNQYNWIDCSSTNQENNHVAFCGDLLDVSFDLPFIDFLPDVIPLKIWVQGEAVDMSLYLPEVNTSRLLLLSIDKNMKLLPCRLKASKWRRKCVKTQGWVDCWSVPIVALSVRYNYHPIPPLGPEPQADITTPEKEEILLSPMRIPRMRKQPQINWAIDGNNFDRTTLAPDKVSVELEVGPSILLAYGTIITSFMNLLENIFGEDQLFTDMQKAPNMDTYFWSSDNPSKFNDRSSINQHTEISIDENSDSSKGPFDPRRVRPLDVSVSIIIHDIQAHLVKNCSENEPPCPVVLIERFGFEMDKSFRETKLQLLLSPSILVSSNSPSRSGSNGSNNSSALQNGHLMLSSFQLRGNGFFSDTNRSVEEETVEYAWMMELQLGQLTGRLTLPQLYQIISSLETFLLLICDNENELTAPNTARQCHHGLNNVLCPETDLSLKYRCPTSNEIKYRMIRVAIDLIDLYIADTNTTLQSWISPIRLSFCNLHGSGFGTGITGLLPNIKLALFTQTNMQANNHHHSSGSNQSQNGSQNKVPDNENWVGVGSMSLGPLLIEAASSLPQSPKNMHLVQQKFLKIHDEKFKRLWFLWPSEGKGTQCGCTGGCAFFGSNRNGANFLKPSPSDLHEGLNIAIFNVIETIPGEYGYGQSLLHQGQLVFHTPPYNSLNVCLQPSNVPTLIPSPLPQNLSKSPQSAERRSLTRRFSYTSVSKGSNNVLVSSTKSDVPYARLVDSCAPLGSSKIDSDSKLNKTILSVPQMESSVSDSKLTLSCGIKDGANNTAKKQIPSENDQFVVPRMPPRSVAVSESHYSLNSQHPHEEAVIQEVQRTMSITSENHSEAFFSADEDMFPSRSSSLKHSFGSRHSKDKVAYAIADASNEKWLNIAPRPEVVDAPDTISNLSAGVQPDSESGSVSSTSFISAISSQEDMTLVNLHMQTNKPIVDSPLLMSSYMTNLPQYRCCNWTTCSLPSGSDVFTLPLFRRAEDGSLVYVGQKYMPSFEPVGKVHTLKLIPRKDGQNQNQHGPFSNLQPHFNSQIKPHPYPQAWWDLQQNVQDNQENTTDKSSASTVTTTSDTKNGLFVKLRGEVDVMLTPLVLESTQKFVESLTPVLANIHPITVINHLRLLCISSVESSNILKQKQYVLNWLPQMQARNGSSLVMEKDDKCKLATITNSNIYEETIYDQLQATVTVPKVNIIFIQSSVVEDMISFSALDNIQDLTCVSLFGVSVENIVAKYASSKKTLESVQLYYRPTLRALGSKKSFGIMKGPRALISTQSSGRKRGPEKGEPVYIETSQQQCEDTTLTLNIGKVHGQLRRTRNESSQLKDAAITGIPCQHSKVSFKFIRADSCAKGCDSMGCQNGASEGQKENAIGYIMFECGIEGVSVKVSKHSQSHKAKEEKKPTKTDTESCRESVKSAEELKPEKEKEKSKRTSGIEDLFRKKDSNSKPSTPNLGAAQSPQVPPVPPAPQEPATPVPDEPSNDSGTTVVPVKDSGNTSSCSIDLKVVWFNFAAPPRTPITKKIDYTRLDWNLLSTASPAINAWMNPCNRLGIRVVALYRARARRLAATAASLMASALDRAPNHTLPKSRYGRHTPMAKQLREEPSLQLCAVLLRYALQADAAAVQADLAERHLPSLSTLRQGVIVLTRQWKNILYTPLLLEHNYKSKVMRPLNVTFALPDLLEDSVEGWQEYQFDNEGLDENCLLLNMDVDKLVTSLPLRAVQSSRASLVFPSLPFTRKTPFQDDAIANYGTLKEDLPTVGSNPSLYSQGSQDNMSSDRAREDLYQWMAKQEPIKVEPKSKKQIIPPSKMNPRAVAAAMPACSLYPLQGSLMLLDAHLVFQPFLSALGVSPHQVAHGELFSIPLEETKTK